MKEYKSRDRARELRTNGLDLGEIRKQLTKEKHQTTRGGAPSKATVARWIADTKLPKVSKVVSESSDFKAFYDSVKGIVNLPLAHSKKVNAIRAIL